jgi:3-methylcrotonyl-CoA carboxylase alpha subunit
MPMISSLLIANRGEIARRIIRTARRLGIATVAIYSEADAGAAYVREADEAVVIGPAPVSESYLRGDAVLAVARQTRAEAIHPGYGFLSENAEFAEAVIAAGRVWVGPPPAAIRAMGRKDAAKRLMAAAGVPVTPGYLGDDQSPQHLAREAAEIGWPVLIKAVAGGGGKGMRAVHTPETFAEALAGARREAASAFGDDRVLLEKLIASPRHIEVQVFADRFGAAVHLFERDCSLQRRHQKVIEEAPAPGMDADTRRFLCEAAVRAARAVDYEGAGTIEFIADASRGLRSDRLWFMEMNTRLQVEHPVTEAITGIDLVEWQLRVASGQPLPAAQDQISIKGHAIEARLYAEDPAHGFLPSVGPLAHLKLPSRVRVDSGVEAGDDITPYYDPMIAKVISHAATRDEAAAGLTQAVRGVEVWPVRTNSAFLARCLSHPDFLAGNLETTFIDGRLDELTRPSEPDVPPAAVAQLLAWGGQTQLASGPSPWNPALGLGGFRLSGPTDVRGRIYVDGVGRDVACVFEGAAEGLVRVLGQPVLFQDGAAWGLSLTRPADALGTGSLLDCAIRTPMPGKVVSVATRVGDEVAGGQVLVVLEAMKMEHGLVAGAAGRVTDVCVAVGDQVSEGIVAVRLEPLVWDDV